MVQTVKEDTLALAVNVGFTSRKGRIIRKILTHVSKQPEFFMKIIYFMMEVTIITAIVFFSTLGYLLSQQIETVMVVFRGLDFITYAIPAPYPIYFNTAYSVCVARLQFQQILCTHAEKTVESGRLKTLCFDKTGTLTQPKMHVHAVYHIIDAETITTIT